MIETPSFEILSMPDGEDALKSIERIGRIAYKSEDKITSDSSHKFVKMLLRKNHLSVIEHCSASVLIKTDRGISHELVRHRLASFTQVSTRYVRYQGEISFIKPNDLPDKSFNAWLVAVTNAQSSYMRLLEEGCSPEIARSILPTCTMTEIVITTNFRQWKHIFDLRCDKAAHPDMRLIMASIQDEFRRRIPFIFD